MKMSQNKKILCIGAHPDDIELNCSGILLGLPFRSINITVTLGEKVGVMYGKKTGGISESTIKSIRKKEFFNAAKMLNAKARILNLEDGNINKTDLKKKIKKIIKEENIILLITHFWDSSHDDHKIVAEVIRDLNLKIPVLYWIDYSCLHRNPKIKINIRKYWKLKCKVLENYLSQIEFSEFKKILSGQSSSKKECFFIFEKDIPQINFLKDYLKIKNVS